MYYNDPVSLSKSVAQRSPACNTALGLMASMSSTCIVSLKSLEIAFCSLPLDVIKIPCMITCL